MPVIEVKNLTHIYMPGSPFETRALDGVNLHIEAGEFIGVIGHTGSGKSTLISYFNALEHTAPGCVFVNGADTGDKKTNLAEVRRGVGLVFQYPEYQLFEETVEKDIAFGPKNQKLTEDEIRARVNHAMEMLGLDAALREQSPFNLSGGQKRRVAIAGVLAMQPDILVLDEPAAGLDPAGRREMLKLIEKIHQSGVTIVMVSHSMDDVGKYCDRLYVLNHGKIAFEGAPRDVFAHGDELRRIGLDVPECETLAERLRDAGIAIDAGAFTPEAMCAQILKAWKKEGAK